MPNTKSEAEAYKENSVSDLNAKSKTLFRAGAIIIACVWLAFGSFAYTEAQATISNIVQKEKTMTTHASGTFDVKLTPQTEDSADATLGRIWLDKQFQGDLEGSSKGQMLTASTAVQGSGVYVAIEKVSGTLQGRKGSFILQHSGTMTRGEPHLAITVVPDSGTGELEGITGKMAIQITDGKHYYDFEYSLTKTP
jgi:hypothetical protein